MKLNRRQVLAAVGTVSMTALLAGCGAGSTSVAASTTSGPTSADSAPVAVGTQTGESSYLSSTGSQVVFVRFTDNGSGGAVSGLMNIVNADANTATGTDTTQDPFTGTRNGSDVALNIGLGDTLTGTLQNGTLSLNIPQTSGQLATETFQSASVDDYNTAVAALQDAGHAQANANAQAQAQAALQAKQTKDEQALQQDLAQLQQDSDFSGDLTNLKNAVSETDSELAQTRSDATKGQGQDCYNVSGTVDYDAEGQVLYAAQGGVEYQLSGAVSPAIDRSRSDIAALQAAAAQLTDDGLPVPATVATAVSAARDATAKAITTANNEIDRTNADVAAAYAVANGMATGSCAGDGPGNPPKGVSHLS